MAPGRLRPADQLLGTSVFAPAALPVPRAVATTLSGAWPFSTQLTSGVSMSNWSADGPPEQWSAPGTQRAKLVAFPLLAARSDSYQVVSLEKMGSLPVDHHLGATVAQLGQAAGAELAA